MVVRLLHACSKATLPSVAFAPGRARRAGQPYNEATRSFPTGYPPNLGGSATPALPSVAPASQHSPFPALQAQARLGLAPLCSSPHCPVYLCYIYMSIL